MTRSCGGIVASGFANEAMVGFGERVRESGDRPAEVPTGARWWGGWAVGLVMLGLVSPAMMKAAELTVTRTVNVGETIGDRQQYASALEVANAGLATISSVTAGVSLSSVAGARQMIAGQYVGTLTYGPNNSGESRSAVAFGASTNRATSLNATYTFASAFDGSWDNNQWTFLVADTVKGGGSAVWNSWSLSVTGEAQSGGTVALGPGGEVAISSGTSSIGTTYTVSAGETSTLRPAAGAVMDFSAGGGGVSGAGTFRQESGGKVVLGDTSGFTGTYQVRDTGSSVKLTSNAALASAAGIDLGAGTKLELGNGVSLSRTVTVAVGETAKLETASATTATVAASALNGVDGTLEKRGAGTTVISGSTSGFDGTLAVREGGVKVEAGANLGADSTVVVARESFNPATDARVTISGTGTVGDLEVGVGGAVGPGNSPGQLNAGNTTWGDGGAYTWEINSFLGSSGMNWDFLNITGVLDIQIATGTFLIEVASLLGSDPGLNTPGDALNFDPLDNYSFAIATASAGINGFDAGKFTLSTANFSNDFYDGVWSLSTSGGSGGPQSLMLNYQAATAIPEPSSAALMVVGLGVLALRRRRCGR